MKKDQMRGTCSWFLAPRFWFAIDKCNGMLGK